MLWVITHSLLSESAPARALVLWARVTFISHTDLSVTAENVWLKESVCKDLFLIPAEQRRGKEPSSLRRGFGTASMSGIDINYIPFGYRKQSSLKTSELHWHFWFLIFLLLFFPPLVVFLHYNFNLCSISSGPEVFPCSKLNLSVVSTLILYCLLFKFHWALLSLSSPARTSPPNLSLLPHKCWFPLGTVGIKKSN